ncbi:hypothetical protein [Alishewanella sp. HH-ZS]|uniref:hypothetical protein n=1 Tax=Alishewanella sp. HH-ZS TaxID=1856684 RepID=UPI000823656F|nr:hypothetical protein [Alishewanella sp. HH-ZS]OCW97997.1 hypothetical protein A9165_03970 [Alishewanella sp. HH-ZS]
MKKLSKVQLKQQAAVMAAVTSLEQQALAELAGVVQAWFSMEYEAFPGSLLVRLQFAEQAQLEAAQPQLLLWQKRLSALMLKKGFVLKDLRKHLVFTLSGPGD